MYIFWGLYRTTPDAACIIRILDIEILVIKHRVLSLQKYDQEIFINISEKIGKLSSGWV